MLLNAWKESNLYNEKEKIILALTDAITLIHKDGVDDLLFTKAEDTFGRVYFSQLIIAIVTINAWNRSAITTHMQPGN